MITIPTADLVGVLSDTIPFACPLPELPTLNCIRVEWDGQMLHTLATDRYRVAWSQWHPDDEPDEGVEAQSDLFTEFGGADDPWHAVIGLEDAKQLVKVFKLPTKEAHAPVTLDQERGQLQVKRSRDTGHSALTALMRAELPDGESTPDLVKLLADADRIEAVKGLSFNAKLLADFAKVRPRGNVMALRFAQKLVHVSIGERFVGAIVPAHEAA